MINRMAIAESRGWTLKEVYKAKDAWRKLYVRQPDSDITFDQYLDLMQSSGLRPDMVGLKRGQYHLARHNDCGAYTIGNCRFVPQEVNQAERKEGYQKDPAFRSLASKIALMRARKECAHCEAMVTPGMFARWHGIKCKAFTGPHFELDRKVYP